MRVLFVIASSVALASCAASVGAQFATRAEFVGRIEATELAIGVSRDGDRVVAYVCGAGASLDSDTAWYEGVLVGDQASLTGPQGAVTLAVSATSATGTVVDSRGNSRMFRVAATTGRDVTGLYESHEGSCRAGVIVWGDRAATDAVSAQGAGCDALGRRSQVTPIRPMSWSAQGLAVRVDAVPQRVLFVRPVNPGR